MQPKTLGLFSTLILKLSSIFNTAFTGAGVTVHSIPFLCRCFTMGGREWSIKAASQMWDLFM